MRALYSSRHLLVCIQYEILSQITRPLLAIVFYTCNSKNNSTIVRHDIIIFQISFDLKLGKASGSFGHLEVSLALNIRSPMDTDVCSYSTSILKSGGCYVLLITAPTFLSFPYQHISYLKLMHPRQTRSATKRIQTDSTAEGMPYDRGRIWLSKFSGRR
jgi:hypothetical protein